MARHADPLVEKLVAFRLGKSQRLLRPQNGDPGKSSMIVQARDPAVAKHQTTGDEQIWPRQFQFDLFASQCAGEPEMRAIGCDVENEFPRRPVVPRQSGRLLEPPRAL